MIFPRSNASFFAARDGRHRRLFGIGVLLLLIPQLLSAELATRSAILREKVAERVSGREETSNEPRSKRPTVLANAGLTYLALGRDPAEAERFFRTALSVQNMDSQSDDYGNVPFDSGNPGAVDQNAIEFTMWSLGTALSGYGEKLSARFQRDILPHLTAALAAIRRHRVPIDYTNIWLMQIANLQMLGKATGDETAIRNATEKLQAWLSFTRANGITEYDSPTYSAVQLACLLEIHRQATEPQLKAGAKAALDFLWADLAANYFPGTQSLSGPFSRSHDFLRPHGSVNYFYFLEGFSTDLSGPDELGGAWLRAASTTYHPSAEIRALATIPERIIRQRFGAAPAADRYNYITPEFAIGSASAFRSSQDLKVCVQLASRKPLPMISIIPENTDAPHGDESARRLHKVEHLRDDIAVVQEKGALLALLDISRDLRDEASGSVATNLIIPMQADAIFLDGERVATEKAFELAAKHTSVVCVREGKAAVALRIFAADGLEGQEAVVSLKYDGNDAHAGRFVVSHYRGEPRRMTVDALRAGVLIIAEKCETDEAFGEFLRRAQDCEIVQESSARSWSASARFQNVHLEAALDLHTRQPLWRRTNVTEVTHSVLTVNGRDLAAELLQPETAL